MNIHRGINIALLVMFVAAGGFSYWFASQLQSQQNQQQLVQAPPSILGDQDIQPSLYTNQTYNFSLQIPKDYLTEEYTDDIVAVGNKVDDVFNRVAEGRVLKSLPSDVTVDLSFEEFVAEKVRFLCGGESDSGLTSCTDIVDQQEFITASGIRGMTFYLTEVSHDILSTEVLQTVAKGPFYAVQLPSATEEGQLSSFVIHPPLALSPDEVQSDLIKQLAESFAFIE